MTIFNSIEALRDAGFTGFVRVAELQENKCSAVPAVRGVYLFYRETLSRPLFHLTSTGGHFKGRNPTTAIADLEAAWVEGAKVHYIGKAGTLTGRATLRSRLRQYMRFGSGEAVGHWGGRYIWQLADAGELLVCWKATPGSEPRAVEKSLIEAFRTVYGKAPFANLSR